jgi:hypothetical protein
MLDRYQLGLSAGWSTVGGLSREKAMGGQPTAEWLSLGKSETPAATLRGKERTILQRQVEALLAQVTDPAIEGLWLDSTHADPVWIDATEARRKAGLPDVVGRRVAGQGVLEG